MNTFTNQRLSLRTAVVVALLVCFATSASAQEDMIVKYKGQQPTIIDFVDCMLAGEDLGELLNGMAYYWKQHRSGQKLDEGVSLVVDTRNGYVRYIAEYGPGDASIVELCYWNFADKRHKLLSWNISSFTGGEFSMGQFSGMDFFLYDNATHRLSNWDKDPQRSHEWQGMPEFFLPRTGKDIRVILHQDDGSTKESVMKWNGSGFDIN